MAMVLVEMFEADVYDVDYGNLDDLVEYGVLEEETAQLSLFNFEKKKTNSSQKLMKYIILCSRREQILLRQTLNDSSHQ